MKFTLSWLREHIDLNPDVDLPRLIDGMTMAGLEVEEVENPAEKLGAFTVAKVIKAEAHPDADKLKVCSVETVDGVKQIVCGAPNARTGLVGIYAPLGTHIPGLDFALDTKPRKIRGVESHGMLCSAKELEAGEDHDGIVDLEGDWKVGDPAAKALGADDVVIDFEVTPNRPDWLGVVGIARDLAAAGLGVFKDSAVAPVKGEGPCPVKVSIEDEAFCPAFGLRLIRGVKNGPSPEWLQRRLRAVGLRPINVLVDVTNFLTYDRARPLHVFDAGKVTGDLTVRWAKKGETILALDGKTYELDDSVGVIADANGVESLAGVMGGEESGCTDATTDVLVEAALWDPLTIARTGRKLGLVSDAQYRFSRGVDPASVEEGLELATRLIVDMCGGTPSESLVAGTIPGAPADIDFDLAEVKRLTGLETSAARVSEILTALGFGVKKGKSGRLTVAVPTWRPDATLPADLVEEVARIEDYDALPEAGLAKPVGRRPTAVNPARRRATLARRALATRGLQEAITWSFVRADQAALFGGENAPRLANPISSELDVMRPTALVHLLLAAQKNADKGWPDAALFEVGPIYLGVEPDDQKMVAAGVRRSRPQRHWAGARTADVFDVKADALAALDAVGAPTANLQVAPTDNGWWHPGRSGRLQLGPKLVLAEFGDIHPRVLKAFDVDGPILAFEVRLDAAPEPRAKATKSKPAFEALELMPVRRDFAFVVDADTAAGDLVKAAAGADKQLVADVAVFDVFEGASIGAGRKSIAIEVTLQPRTETLDDKALDAVSSKIVAAVAKATGGSLRA